MEVDLLSLRDELTSTYFNFIEALTYAVKIHGICRALVLSPSRVIDELNGLVTPINQSFHTAMSQQVLPYLIDVEFTKISEEEFDRVMAKAGDIIDQSSNRDITPRKNQQEYIQIQRKTKANQLRKSFGR